MKIANAVITISQSSLFLVEPSDVVEYCVIEVKKSTPGTDHPIVIKSGASFKSNCINSEIESPILCDAKSGDDFSNVRDNLVKVI